MTSLKHIVIDARFFRRATGGIGRYIRALIRELAGFNAPYHYTVLLTPADTDDWQAFAQKVALPKNVWQSQVIDIPHYSLAEQTKLPRLLTDLKPDLVHFTNFNHPLQYQKPFVVTFHDLTILKFPVGSRQRSPLAQLGFRLTVRHALRQARHILTVSEASKDDLVTHLGADPQRIAVTYEGIDSQYQPVNLPQQGRLQTELVERYQLHSPYLLFVSQWRPHKGIGLLLDAYDEFRTHHSRLKPPLVLVGAPNPNYPEIPARIDASPYRADILRPGFVPEEDLPLFYQAAAVFVFPSIYEGFGLTPLEAMACGTPVIASQASCLPEILGEAALYAKPNDPASWVTAIETLLTDRSLWQKYRTAGLAQARRYSWHTMAQQTLAVYERALGSKS